MQNPVLKRLVETIRKHKILTAVCAVFISLFIVVLIFPFVYDISSLKPLIETAMSTPLGMEVRIGRIEGFSILPAGISLRNLTIENRGEPVARTDRAEIRFDLFSLIRGRFHIRKLELLTPEFKIIKNNNGKYNFERDEKEGVFPSASLQKLVMSDGIIYYSNEKSGDEMAARHCDIDVDDLVIEMKGGSEIPLSFTAECFCKEVGMHSVTLSDLELHANSREEGIAVKPVRFALFGGEGKGEIDLDLKPSVSSYRIKCGLSDFSVGDVFQAFSKKSKMEGKMDFSADLSFSGDSVADIKRTMNGEVSLTGKDLVIHGMDLDSYIGSYEDIDSFNFIDIGAFFLVGPVGSLLTLEFDFASMTMESGSGKSIIPEFISEWEVRKGVASAKDVAMTTRKNRIALQGSIDFVDKEFKDIRIAALNDRGCAKFTQTISGSFLKPEISKVGPLETLVRPLAGLVKEAGEFLKDGKCDVFYSGSVKQPE